MILTTSERSLEDDMKNLQMGETAVATKEGGLSLSRNLDLTDIVYPSNREVVSFENASINVDSSTDVIFGPVTQLNVNGNVTIVQNGNEEGADDGKSEKKQSNIDAKLEKTEKSSFEDQDQKFFNLNKKIFKILVAIIISLFFIIAIITVFVIELNSNHDIEINNQQPNDDTENLRSHQIITRKYWGGTELGKPKGCKNITAPVDMVIIKHTGGGTCNSFELCAGKVRTIYGTNIAKRECDIYCNFLIGGDGNIYEGRGWDIRNQQRDSTIDIVFLGSFDYHTFTHTMAEAALLLIADGVKKGKLDKNYKIVNHNQTASQRSPGANVFNEVVHWPNYDGRLYFGNRLQPSSSLD